ncbi:VOC family protein [Chryseolinea sp. H1M3-3]|uniref:VOC family protein n=1 Tax=Chryseolinea sp. H1M3-3 TaxID=3034144 RepID=UPI0023ED02C1|nr:VOC family protein [Chryseolinea sp. H1M3-3]
MTTQKIASCLWVEIINCKDQKEVDYYWGALTANGGAESSCGWCKDKYGLSWQIVPVEYFDLINGDDPMVREKAMKNTLEQKKNYFIKT